MINFQCPLLSEKRDSATNSKVQELVFSPPGVKTRSRRSSIYTSLKHKELEPTRKVQGSVKITEIHSTDHNSVDNSIKKTKKGNTQKMKNTKNFELPSKPARHQSLKRKGAENKALPVTKHVKKEQTRPNQTERNETSKAGKKMKDVLNDSAPQGCVESNGQLQSIQSAIVVLKSLNNLNMSPCVEGKASNSGLSGLEDSVLRKNQLKVDENESLMNLVTLNHNEISKTKKKSLGFFTPSRTKLGQEDPVEAGTASKGHLHQILNQGKTRNTELCSQLSYFSESHQIKNTSFETSLSSTSQCKTPLQKNQVEIVNVIENSNLLQSIASIENKVNGSSIKRSVRQPSPGVVENLHDVDSSILSSSQLVSSEDDLEDISFGYTGLSQRCTIL